MLSRVQKSGVFVAAGQVDRACSREDVFAFYRKVCHLSHYCLPMLLPSFGIAQLPLPPDSKLQALLSLFSHILTSFESLFNFPSLPSHLKYSFLHVLLFPYIHGYSSASALGARCSTTKATRSFAIACGGPGQGPGDGHSALLLL